MGWLAVGVAAEMSALVKNQGTLSDTLRIVVNSKGRRLVWGAFCIWGLYHITFED